ncbi:hypothetical protein [Corynebacterium efficiens]|uniref:hypothetical protein n=1 Tax=Corynebacterium efficiens TaxID=152794 RepID=UPI0002E22171|nr:hypothetical protein [Corynebacterium efficiens]
MVSTRTGIARATLVFIAVAVLLIALIAPATRSTAPTEPTTPTPTAEMDYAQASTDLSNLSSGFLPPARSPASPLVPQWSELPQDPRGAQVTINGEPSTICIYGDGWGTNVWAGNAQTSCRFVTAVQEELTRGLNPTYDNLRAHLKQHIRVTSPTTGLTYDLTCRQLDHILMSCTGGNNAAVYAY